MSHTPILLKRTDLLKMVGLSYPTINAMEKKGLFPARKQLSETRVGWLYDEVVAWAHALSNGTPGTPA